MSTLRRPRHLIVAILLLLAIVVASALLFRVPLADQVLAGYLDRLGVPGHAQVKTLGPGGARLDNVRLEELDAERIDIDWKLSLDGGVRVLRIAVWRPTLTLDLTREHGPFAGLRQALARESGGVEGEALAVVPLLNVDGGRASIVTGQGPVTLNFSLSSHRSGDAAITYAGDLSARGLGLSADGDFKGELDALDPTGLDVALQLQGSDSDNTARGVLRARRLDRELKVLAEAAGRVSAGEAFRLGLVPEEVSGEIEFELSSESVWPTDMSIDGATLLPLRLQAEYRVAGERLAWASWVEGGRVDWAGSVAWDPNRETVHVRPARPLVIDAASVSHELLPAAAAGLIAPQSLRGVSLSLDMAEIDLSPRDATASVEDASLLLLTGSADQLSARGNAHLSLREGLAIGTRFESQFNLPRSIAGLAAVEGSLVGELARSDSSVTVTLLDRLSLSLTPDRSVLPDSLAFLAGESLRLFADGDAVHDGRILHLSAAGERIDFDLGGEIDLDSRIAGLVKLRGRAGGQLQPDTVVIELSDVQLDALAVETPRVRLERLAAQGHGRVEVAAEVASGSGQIAFAPVIVDVDGRRLSLGAGEAELSRIAAGPAMLGLRLAMLEATQEALAARNILVKADHSEDGITRVVLEQATVEDLWLPARFPPISVTGTARQSMTSATASLKMSPQAAPMALLEVDATYNRRRELGGAEFNTSGLVFSESLQPKALWPGLKLLENVVGELALRGEARFDSEGLIDSGGRMDLSLSSFESDGMQVSGFSMPLRLSSLWPVESLPDQRLTVARVADGAELTDIELDYRLIPKPAGPPLLEIAQASMNLLGGRVRMGHTSYDPDGEMETALVEAEGLDLVSVLSLISSEGLGGQGRLKGRFPVRLEDGSLVVEDALLEAEAPGILRFDSPQTAQTLSAAGDHVNLLLSALRNFHYDTLTLSADKPAHGETTLLLSLAGNNPDVLEGYPFKLNIGLETDAAPLLAMFRQGTNLFDEVIKRVWRPGASIR